MKTETNFIALVPGFKFERRPTFVLTCDADGLRRIRDGFLGFLDAKTQDFFVIGDGIPIASDDMCRLTVAKSHNAQASEILPSLLWHIGLAVPQRMQRNCRHYFFPTCLGINISMSSGVTIKQSSSRSMSTLSTSSERCGTAHVRTAAKRTLSSNVNESDGFRKARNQSSELHSSLRAKRSNPSLRAKERKQEWIASLRWQ
jgi:hypothetical protein